MWFWFKQPLVGEGALLKKPKQWLRRRLIIVLLFQKMVNKKYFTAKITVVIECLARLWTNLYNLHISQDTCYVLKTDNNDFLTINGHRDNWSDNI